MSEADANQDSTFDDIDEFGGDLPRIGRLWDRGSEKILRRLIKEYGLTERLEAARTRSRKST